MNTRWDAVVDADTIERRRPPLPTSQSVIDQNTGSIRVRVQLFGALAALSGQQSVELAASPGATIGDIFEIVGERLGENFLTHVIDASGAKRRHCRLFVAGYPAEDLQTPLHPASGLTEIDIILLIAPEGG